VPSWSEVEAEAPQLAAPARTYLDAHMHKTLATIRRDGSPRISGTEITIAEGELWFGSMWQAVKALDLLRDPRFALHSGSDDPPDWHGDAKLAGRAEEISDQDTRARIIGGKAPPGPSHLFRADIEEVTVVRLDETRSRLVIESWHAGRGLTRLQR
jgi:hypothetical protein